MSWLRLNTITPSKTKTANVQPRPTRQAEPAKSVKVNEVLALALLVLLGVPVTGGELAALALDVGILVGGCSTMIVPTGALVASGPNVGGGTAKVGVPIGC